MKKAGELLQQASPYAHVLAQKQRGFRCDFCFALNDKLKKCTACRTLQYCNSACQRSDWYVHKEECQCLQRVSPKNPVDSVRLMLRLIIKHKKGDFGNTVKDDPGWRTFKDFQTHKEEIKNDTKRCDQLSQIVYTLTALLGDTTALPPAEDVLDIFGKMTINSFTVCDGEMQFVGVAVYLSASLLDHSCTPNAVVTFQGSRLQVRATQNISDPSPKNILISYIDQLSTSSERREKLQQQYYFQCNCERCRDNQLDEMMLSLDCQNSESAGNCEGCHLKQEGNGFLCCTDCGYSIESENYQKIEDFFVSCQECLDQLTESEDAADKLLIGKSFIKKNSKYFSARNIHCLRILDKLLDAAIDCQKWEMAVDYGTKTVTSYRKYYPPNSPNVGIQLMKIGKLLLYLQKCQQALVILQQAEAILLITHGRSHDLYSQLTELLSQCHEEMRVNLEFALEDRP